ncbi:MAG: hypothetical protein WBA41_20835 [Rivularia sp. (in: cyanobacteria)]
MVGWVERSETQQTVDNVGFRSSTQPTVLKSEVSGEADKFT